MKSLIPTELLPTIPKLYETEDQIDPIVHIKLFLDGWTWFITELSIDKDICFGYVISPFGSELGYVSLEELASLVGSFGIGVERDNSFKPTPLSIIKKAQI
ncbi:MAG: DUF2958 domain-containing protein [Arcobacteraceae bacterium]|jgi:hypothetical protein|nr:DUF2958 domain-containing protein [Arcobacteraceae bacterium]